jgi:hypothetical protein
MPATEVRVSVRHDYASTMTGVPPSAWSVVKKPVPRHRQFRASAVIVLLALCTVVALLDMLLMAAGLQ